MRLLDWLWKKLGKVPTANCHIGCPYLEKHNAGCVKYTKLQGNIPYLLLYCHGVLTGIPNSTTAGNIFNNKEILAVLDDIRAALEHDPKLKPRHFNKKRQVRYKGPRHSEDLLSTLDLEDGRPFSNWVQLRGDTLPDLSQPDVGNE